MNESVRPRFTAGPDGDILVMWQNSTPNDRGRDRLIGVLGTSDGILGGKVNGSFVYRFGDDYAFEEELDCPSIAIAV